MQATLRQTAPRLAYPHPGLPQPDRRARARRPTARAVLRSARQAGTTVVVDESFVDLGFRGGERAGGRASTRR